MDNKLNIIKISEKVQSQWEKLKNDFLNIVDREETLLNKLRLRENISYILKSPGGKKVTEEKDVIILLGQDYEKYSKDVMGLIGQLTEIEKYYYEIGLNFDEKIKKECIFTFCDKGLYDGELRQNSSITQVQIIDTSPFANLYAQFFMKYKYTMEADKLLMF